MKDQINKNALQSPEISTNAGEKRSYQKPKLIEHGDVRDITFGPSPGTGESGAPSIRRP